MYSLKKISFATMFVMFMFSGAPSAFADENAFKAIGKIIESRYDHTTKHEHKLKFVRLDDGEIFDIEESPELLREHCQSEKDSVIEVEGYLTGKFLFWGGDLVVTNYKVHGDIEVPVTKHVDPKTLPRRHEVRPTRGGPR